LFYIPQIKITKEFLCTSTGGDAGFTTLVIVKHVDAKNVTILDQSSHQQPNQAL